MTAPELADTYVPVPLRWRHVQPGDVIVGADGRLWAIEETAVGPTDAVHAVCGQDSYTADVDPDAAVTVLMPATEHDAMTLLRDELGARLIERRTA